MNLNQSMMRLSINEIGFYETARSSLSDSGNGGNLADL